MREQRLLVCQNLIQAAVECILLHQRVIRTEQIRHRTLLEPQSVQSPLAAWINQPIADQRLQDVLPAGSFPRIRQTARPEAVQLELLVQMTRQPAGTPLPRPMQLHRLEPNLHAMRPSVLGNRAIGRKQGQLRMATRPFIKRFDHTAPSLVLTVVDLAQVQHLPLHHLAASAALTLDNIPVAMFFAVLEASIESQEHDANQPTPNKKDEKDTWSTLQTICERAPLI